MSIECVRGGHEGTRANAAARRKKLRRGWTQIREHSFARVDSSR